MAREVMYTDAESGISRVHWNAVFAGLFIALVSQILLGLFGLAVGLSSFNPVQGTGGFGVGSGVWLIISTLISVFLGAWAASWWANTVYRAEGILHGILTWSLFLIVTLFFLGSGIGSILGGAFNLVSAGIYGASQGVAMGTTMNGPLVIERQASATMDAVPINNRLNNLLGQAETSNRAYINLNHSPSLKLHIAQQIAAGNDQTAANLIVRNTGISQARAMSFVQNAKVPVQEVAQSQQAARKIRVREVSQKVTTAAGRIAWWAFFASLLSLIAAGLGGLMGIKHRYTTVL